MLTRWSKTPSAWRRGTPRMVVSIAPMRHGLRDLATVVLIDVSESTREASVLEMERLAVSLLGDALGATHDPVALLAFASDGRERVGLTRVKDFEEPFGPAARSRLAGLEAGLSTRLGAALRHAGAELQRRRASRRLVLVMTDAEPSDIDVDRPARSCRRRGACDSATERQWHRCLGHCHGGGRRTSRDAYFWTVRLCDGCKTHRAADPLRRSLLPTVTALRRVRAGAQSFTIANARTGEPEPPLNFSGAPKNWNSPLPISSSRLISHSQCEMPSSRQRRC